MILCDTNILIHAFNGNPETIEALRKIGYDQVILSSITVMELYQGMRNKNELAQMKSSIKFFDFLEVDLPTSQLALNLVEQYTLSHGLAIPDALIGASAIIHSLPLFTYNRKDFAFLPDIKLHEP